MSQRQALLDKKALLLKKLRERKAAGGEGTGNAPGTTSPALPKKGQDRIPAIGRSGPLAVSFGQERLWLLDQLQPSDAAFNMPLPLRLRGRLDRDALRRAVAELVRRHESLRTTFAVEGSLPVQRIHPPGFVAPVEVDLRDLDPDARRREAEALIEADAAEPFDLARGPLYRATLVRLQDDEHLLLQNMHHVISDGWSTGVLFKELRTLLGAFTEGRPSPLPEPELHYADFAAWQRKRLSGEVLDRQVAFWRRQLEGAATSLGLPTDRPRPSVATSRGDHIEARLVADAVGPLRDLARGAKGTLYMVLLTAFKILLHRMSGQGDISVGTPVAGRERLETQDLVGFFLNTLTLRSQIEGKDTFRDLLGRVRSTVLEAKAHQEVPFEKLLQELQPERHLSQAPFFQVMFNMANIPDLRFELPGLEIEHLSWGEVGSKFDLTLYVLEDGDGSLALNLAYNVDLFDRARMVEMLRQYQALLSQIAAAPDSPVGGFDLLTDAARRTLPNPAAPLPAGWNGTVAEGVARHAAADPARLAVTDPVAAVTYGELLTRSRRIARRLLGLGIETGDVVAVWAHRSAPLAESMLGILQAGAAFTMLDPQYPEGRLLDYLSLANPKALLRMERAGELPPEVLDALAAAGTTALDLPAEGAVSGPWADASDGGPSDRDPQVAIGPDDLAYVAFTSGSTGKPKAILGRHGSLTAFLPWLQETFHFDRRDRHSLLSALSHDPLHRDVFMPLWYGAALAIPDPERIGEPGYAATWARDQGVTILNLVPAMLQLLTSTAGDVRLPALRHAFTVGDVLTRADVDALYGVAPNAVAVNLFGSTETQRAVSHVILPREPQLDPRSELGTGGLGKAALPLGRGLDGVQLLVLGDAGRQAGVGEVGEIHVRSHHLALGYTDAELTRERFLPNPFSDTPGDRLYRTGDLGRYLPDGGVEYLGRADFQVKIRGFRIELQEIETALGRHPAVADCAVVVRGDAGEDRFLAAYLVAVDGGEIPPHRALRAHLSKQLPDYMVPATFTVLDALPLTRTGKLDRRALPEPEAPSSDGARRPPSTPEEQTLAAIWESLLGRENLGLDDGFFELGGHSLLATQVLARLRDAFEVELPLRVFFEHPTLGELAAALAQARRDDRGVAPPPLVPVPRDRALPLSFSQQRLWFLDRLEPESPAYVLSGAVRIRGPLDAGALERAFVALVERHEALRTRIVEDAGRGLQRIDPPRSQSLPVEDLSHLQPEPRLELARRRATAEARRPFRLDRDPLLRTGLLRLAGDDHVLLVSIHHIVSDGWSLGILFRELGAFYAAENGGAEVNLPTLPIQFADYAAWERTWLDGPVLERQLAFWTEHLAGAPPLLELPTDRPRPAAQTFSGARHHVRIDAAVAQGLEGLGRDLGATPFMALLGAWALVLGRHAGQDDVVVGTPIAHRGRTELEGVLGFFANTLPLRTRLAGDGGEVPTFADLLARVRRSVLDAFAHQDLPFEKLVTELDAPRDLAYSP
ncbi:MAG: amino acid adenylation domain-containing protein, partial [Acidobacteriota bacterium]